jgi:hypothetical protein
MWIARKVRGMSMMPALQPGMVVVARQKRVKPGDIVIAEMQGREVVKRVKNIKDNKLYLVGDNSLESTDSRELGPVNQEAVKGTVFAILPRATYDERSIHERTIALSLGAIILIMVTTQLVRFDTFIPILDEFFTSPMALAVGSCMVLLEVFAVPFLLGMALSPLARIMSLACVWLVAIGWTIWGFWSFSAKETGHLGSFVTLPPGLWAPLFGAVLMVLIAMVTWRTFRKRA